MVEERYFVDEDRLLILFTVFEKVELTAENKLACLDTLGLH
jgi:hypothetical protein